MSFEENRACVKCGRENPVDSQFCGYCGSRMSDLTEKMVIPCENENSICEKCGKENPVGSQFCGYCGNACDMVAKHDASSQVHELQAMLELQCHQLEELRKLVKQQAQQIDTTAKCPHCGSNSLVGNKKGYGIGKGVIGAAVFGPIGLIAGNIGSDEVRMTCLNCGRQYQRSFGSWRRIR